MRTCLFQTGTIADSEGAIQSDIYISNPHLPDISNKELFPLLIKMVFYPSYITVTRDDNFCFNTFFPTYKRLKHAAAKI